MKRIINKRFWKYYNIQIIQYFIRWKDYESKFDEWRFINKFDNYFEFIKIYEIKSTIKTWQITSIKQKYFFMITRTSVIKQKHSFMKTRFMSTKQKPSTIEAPPNLSKQILRDPQIKISIKVVTTSSSTPINSWLLDMKNGFIDEFINKH